MEKLGYLVARYGGEEFVIILPNADSKTAVRVANIVRERVKALRIKRTLSEDTVEEDDVSEVLDANGMQQDLHGFETETLHDARDVQDGCDAEEAQNIDKKLHDARDAEEAQNVDENLHDARDVQDVQDGHRYQRIHEDSNAPKIQDVHDIRS